MPAYKLARKTTSKRSIVIIALVAAAVLFAAYFIFVVKPAQERVANIKVDSQGQKIDYNPPTEKEKQETDQHKEDLVRRESELAAQQSQAASGVKHAVAPVIVDAGVYGQNVEVRAYISGTVENGGTCTITLTRGSVTVARQAEGIQDATTTRCPNTTIPKSEFSNGTWTVSVSYNSEKSEGKSKSQILEIQ